MRRMRTLCAIILAAACIAALACDAKVVRDIPYAPENGKFGLGDLYLPRTGNEEQEMGNWETPVILTIHGGGWGGGQSLQLERRCGILLP